MSIPEDPRIFHVEMGVWGDYFMLQYQAYFDERSQESCGLEVSNKTAAVRGYKTLTGFDRRLPDVSLDTPNEYSIISCEGLPSHVGFNGVPNLCT